MTLVLLLFTGGCAWCDLKKRRIPNKLIVTGGLIFILMRFALGFEIGYASGWNEILPGIRAALISGMLEVGGFFLRAVILICVMFPVYALRMMGAGDIKLAAVLLGGAGMESGLWIIFCGLAAAGLWSLFIMIYRRLVRQRIRYLLFYMWNFWVTKTVEPYYIEARDGREMSFCMAPSLFFGVIAAEIIRHI